MTQPLRVFEAFSGIGTQRMALRNIGVPHEVVAIAEIDGHAVESYQAIHGKTLNLGDIQKIKLEDIPDHDLLTYSFPCQDLSFAGKRQGLVKGSGTRSSLLWDCERIIEYKRPQYLMLENVKALVGKTNKTYFDEWLRVLEGYGYTNYWQVLNAKDYNVPQNRERVFVISIHGKHKPYEFPPKQPLTTALTDVLETDVAANRYLPKDRVNALLWEQTLPVNRVMIGASRGRNPSNPSDRTTGSPTKQRLEINHQGISNTLTTVQKDNYVVDTTGVMPKVRKLTPRECWRLMGCSDTDFDKASQVTANSQLVKQAGNAIVVNVLEALFKNLFFE